MKDPRLRLLFVGPMLGRHPGWVPNPAEQLAPRLLDHGYECILVSDELGRFRRLVDILLTIWKYRKQIDILCLQVYSGPSFVVQDLVSMVAQRLGLPVIMHLHGGGLPDFIRRFPNWSRRVFCRARMMVVPSGYLAQTIRSLGFNAKVIPNAIDLGEYPFRHRKAPQPELLWMRTFHAIYHPIMAVEVLAQVKRVHPQARLTMGGQEKGLLEATRQRAYDLGVADSVRFVGFLFLEGKRLEFDRNDIFLNTNRVDNMPVSVVEAAAFGMPIVATKVGGLPYLLHDGENGLLVPDEDVDAMAGAVRRLIEEPGLAERLSRNARSLAETHDWSIVLPQWESLFRELAEKTAS